MRKEYKAPKANVEGFVANRSVASCTSVGKTFDFYCLQGGNLDTHNVFESGTKGCTINPVIATGDIDYAIKVGSREGSTGTTYGTVTSSNSNSYTGRYITIPDGKTAMYFCTGSDKTSKWHVDGNVVYHEANSHSMQHCQVIAVNPATVSAS